MDLLYSFYVCGCLRIWYILFSGSIKHKSMKELRNSLELCAISSIYLLPSLQSLPCPCVLQKQTNKQKTPNPWSHFRHKHWEWGMGKCRYRLELSCRKHAFWFNWVGCFISWPWTRPMHSSLTDSCCFSDVSPDSDPFTFLAYRYIPPLLKGPGQIISLSTNLFFIQKYVVIWRRRRQ